MVRKNYVEEVGCVFVYTDKADVEFSARQGWSEAAGKSANRNHISSGLSVFTSFSFYVYDSHVPTVI